MIKRFKLVQHNTAYNEVKHVPSTETLIIKDEGEMY